MRVGEEVGASTLEHDLSLGENVSTVGVRERHVDELLDDQNGGPSRVHVSEDLEKLRDDQGPEPERQLVDDQHLRIGHHGPGDSEHLLLAAGQRPGRLLGPFSQDREEIHHPVAAFGERRAGTPERPEAGAQVVLDRESGEELAAFRQVGDTAADHVVRLEAVYRNARERDRPRGGSDQTRDRPQRGGLPGPVGAEQGDALAVADRDRDVA